MRTSTKKLMTWEEAEFCINRVFDRFKGDYHFALKEIMQSHFSDAPERIAVCIEITDELTERQRAAALADVEKKLLPQAARQRKSKRLIKSRHSTNKAEDEKKKRKAAKKKRKRKRKKPFMGRPRNIGKPKAENKVRQKTDRSPTKKEKRGRKKTVSGS